MANCPQHRSVLLICVLSQPHTAPSTQQGLIVGNKAVLCLWHLDFVESQPVHVCAV